MPIGNVGGREFASSTTRQYNLRISASDQASGTLNKVQTGLRALGKGLALGQIGNGMVNLGEKILGVGVAAGKMAADFDTSFARIGPLTGKLGVNLEQARQHVLALSGATGQSATDLADALYFVGSAGLKASQVMPVLDTAAKGAAIGMGSAADVGKSLIFVLNAYRGTNLTAAQAANIFTEATKLSAAEVNDFGASLGPVIGVAANAGIRLQDITAAIAQVTNVGVPFTRAVTGFRFLISSLEAPTAAANDALHQYGFSAEQIHLMLAKPGGLIYTLQALANHFDLSSAKGREAWRAVVGGARGAVVATDLIGKHTGQARQILAAMNREGTNTSGVFQKAFDIIKARDPQLALAILEQHVKAIAITLANTFLPAAIKVLDFFNKLVDAFERLSPHTRELIARAALIAGAFLLIQGKIVLLVASFYKLYALVRLAGIGFGGLAVTLGTIIAVTLLLGGAALIVIRNWNRVGPFFIGLWRSVERAATDAWQKISAIFSSASGKKAQQTLLNLVKDLAKVIRDIIVIVLRLAPPIVAAVVAIAKAAAPLLDILLKVADAILRWRPLVPIIEGILAAMAVEKVLAFGAAMFRVGRAVSQLFTAFGTTVELGILKFLPILGGILVDTVIPALGAAASAVFAFGAALLANPVTWWVVGIAAIAAVAFLLVKHWRGVVTFFKTVWGELMHGKEIFAIVLAALVPFLGIPILIIKHWRQIGPFIMGIWKTVTSFLKGVWATIQRDVAQWTRDFVRVFERLPGQVWRFVQRIGKDIAHGFVVAGEAILNFLKQLPKWIGYAILVAILIVPALIYELGKAIVVSLRRGIDNYWDEVVNFFKDLPGNIARFFVNAGHWLYNAGRTVIRGFIEGYKAVWHDVQSFFANAGRAIARYFMAAGRWLLQAGHAIINGLWQGIQVAYHAVTHFFATLPGRVERFFARAAAWLLSAGRRILHGLQSGIDTGATSVWSFFTRLPGRILRFFASVLRWLYNSGRSLLTGLWHGISAAWRDIAAWFSRLPGVILRYFANASKWLYNVGREIFQGLWDGIKSVWDKMTGWLSGIGHLIGGLKGPIDKDYQLLIPHGTAIMRGLHHGMLSQMPHLRHFLRRVVSTISDFGANVPVGFTPGGMPRLVQSAAAVAPFAQTAGVVQPTAAAPARVPVSTHSSHVGTNIERFSVHIESKDIDPGASMRDWERWAFVHGLA